MICSSLRWLANGLLQPIVLFLRQSNRHGLGLDFSRPDITAALLP